MAASRTCCARSHCSRSRDASGGSASGRNREGGAQPTCCHADHLLQCIEFAGSLGTEDGGILCQSLILGVAKFGRQRHHFFHNPAADHFPSPKHPEVHHLPPSSGAPTGCCTVARCPPHPQCGGLAGGGCSSCSRVLAAVELDAAASEDLLQVWCPQPSPGRGGQRQARAWDEGASARRVRGPDQGGRWVV